MSLKPTRLSPGDVVGVVSPSWGGAGVFPKRYLRGVSQLEHLGYSVRAAKHALNQRGYVSDTPANRAADLHEMFADPQVGAIVSAIGGDHSCQLLSLLDYDLIRAHPKILCGFSDATVLNVALWAACGLVTFNGPALLTDFAEYPNMLAYTRDNWLSVVTNPSVPGPILPAAMWTEEFLDWGTPPPALRARVQQPSPGWTWLKPGAAEGVLIGGCIESLEHLRGTRWWPNWQGAILFFETSEDKPTPERIDAILADYDNMGVMAQINGLLVGRPLGYTESEKQTLREVLLERTASYRFPIVADMDFGHTSPQMTLPVGVRSRVDSARQVFEIIESAVI